MNMIMEDSNKWSQIINETLGIQDKSKLGWMSKYAQNHEIYEGLQATTGNVAGGIYSTPLNTIGMGNPMMPTGVGFNGANGNASGVGIGNTGSDFHAANYQVGSGDIPMSTLTMSLEVAAMTIGLELVPVIPANGPWAMLSYFDTPYAGGKLGRINETAMDGKGEGDINKPIYIKLKGYTAKVAKDAEETITVGENKFYGVYMGLSRIDAAPIYKVVKCEDKEEKTDTLSIGDVFKGSAYTPDLVASVADHIQGFANFFDGADDPMTRAQNETGVGNTIGARLFTKLVQMGSYEVTGTVTRQQLQDLPLYGIDVIGKVLESLQNQISQNINNRILDRVFKLGVTNAEVQKAYQNLDLNLNLGTAAADEIVKWNETSVGQKFYGIDNQNKASLFETSTAINADATAENFMTLQRRVFSRVLAAANVITNVSRFGRANWVVTNTQIATALQDNAAFVIAPMVNTLTQDGSSSLYFTGSIAGLNLYVDPYMTWDDTRVCVGRKSDGNTPGVVFMPYILADTVQTIVEGTMAPKLLVNSRFAIVDAGFHPEQNYFTFMVHAPKGLI